MQRIFLLRHGEIQGAGTGKRFIGHTDIPLSDVGCHQAQGWRHWFGDFPRLHIIASDLARCQETVRIIAADRSWSLETSGGFKEIYLGQWDGLSFRQVKERWPEAFQQRGEDLAGFRPPGGESFLDLQRRVIPVFEKAVKEVRSPLLIVAHAGVNRIILGHILGMPLGNLFRIPQDYGALNLIERHAGEYRLQLLNQLPGSAMAS